MFFYYFKNKWKQWVDQHQNKIKKKWKQKKTFLIVLIIRNFFMILKNNCSGIFIIFFFFFFRYKPPAHSIYLFFLSFIVYLQISGILLIVLATLILKSAPQNYVIYMYIIGGVNLGAALLGCCGICHEHVCMTATVSDEYFLLKFLFSNFCHSQYA